MLRLQSAKQFTAPSFTKDILIIAGGYGSGKSEVAINLARHLAISQHEQVAIADLDIVNTYFRSREADQQLEELDVRPLNPGGRYRYADLPIILPEIKGAIKRHQGKLVLDVGGDDAGARVLSSLKDAFKPSKYELLLVLNTKRPFSRDFDSCLKLIREIEMTSRLMFSGIISNTHLLTETTSETVLEGLRFAHGLHERTNLPVVFLSASEEVLENIDPHSVDVPVLKLNRFLLKPWERNRTGHQKASPQKER